MHLVSTWLQPALVWSAQCPPWFHLCLQPIPTIEWMQWAGQVNPRPPMTSRASVWPRAQICSVQLLQAEAASWAQWRRLQCHFLTHSKHPREVRIGIHRFVETNANFPHSPLSMGYLTIFIDFFFLFQCKAPFWFPPFFLQIRKILSRKMKNCQMTQFFVVKVRFCFYFRISNECTYQARRNVYGRTD